MCGVKRPMCGVKRAMCGVKRAVATGRAQPRIGERTMAALAKHAIYPRRDWLSRSRTRGHFPTSKTLDLTLFFARRALVIGRVRRASCFPTASLVDFTGSAFCISLSFAMAYAGSLNLTSAVWLSAQLQVRWSRRPRPAARRCSPGPFYVKCYSPRTSAVAQEPRAVPRSYRIANGRLNADEAALPSPVS